jgi:hypothetical protein
MGYPLLHFVLPILFRLILLLEVALRFSSPFKIARVYLLLSCLNIILQLSNATVFTKIGQCGSSFVDFFVQLCYGLADLFDFKPVLLYFRLKAKDSISTFLKPLFAFISYIPKFWSSTTAHETRGTHRSICLLALSSISAFLLSSWVVCCA